MTLKQYNCNFCKDSKKITLFSSVTDCDQCTSSAVQTLCMGRLFGDYLIADYKNNMTYSYRIVTNV